MNIRVELGGRSYPIRVERGGLAKAETFLNLARRVLIVTDEGVPEKYAKTVAEKCLQPVIVTVPEGEQSKSFSELEHLCRVMLEKDFTRTDCVVAVGGGVVGDLAGFAAACFMRGVDFYNIPTTVLSQVDSSIGGKTAVNLAGVKNTVGAFYQPKAVLIDPDTLSTLPPRQISNGLAEALKMAVTFDADLFEIFERGEAMARLDEIIVRSLKIKADVVRKDEREAGLRKVLNFGHTVGHGIESAAGLHGLYHGECVGLGMLPMCGEKLRPRVLSALQKLKLPTQSPVAPEAILAALSHDKKTAGDTITVVYSDAPGTFEMRTLPLADFRRQIADAL